MTQPKPHEQSAQASDRPPHGRNRPSGAITTNCCDAFWTGLTTAHCSVCHRTFTGVWAFDKHRVGTSDTRHCVDPMTVGLALLDRGSWQGWGNPKTWSGPQ